MNVNLLKAAKRVAEICQESKEPYSNLTMIAALKQTEREFLEDEEMVFDFKKAVDKFIY